jgi:hypothetical protein
MTIQTLTVSFVRAVNPKLKAKESSWVKAKEGFVSVNVDATFELDTRRESTGAVVRDAKGNFLAANNNPIDYALDATTSEAMAIRHGMYLANQLGANKLIVQSDCKEMVEVSKDGGFTAMAAAPIIEYICIQALCFTKLDCVFVLETQILLLMF